MERTATLACAAVLTLVARMGEAQGVKVEHLNPPELSKPTGYTHIVTMTGGKLVYIAGQVGIDAKGEVVGKADLAAQARQVYANLKAALAAVGARPKDLVKTTTFVVNYRPEMLPVIREARAGFLGPDAEPPASTLVGVQALAREEFLIEIEAIAAVP